MTEADTVELLGLIGNLFPARMASDVKSVAGMARIWHKMLVDLEAADALEALAEYATQDNAFPPSVGQLRTLAVRRKLNIPDDASAWEEVMKAIRRYGRNHEPAWSNPAIASAVDAIGWLSLCNTMDDDMPTVRAQFRGFLQNTSGREERRANIGALEKASPAVLSLVDGVTKKLTGK